MTPQDIAYLARYGFALLIFLMGTLLLKSSLVDFRGRMQLNLRPVKGYFLMAMGESGENQLKSYPLFHTTTIGSAKSNDIHIKLKGIAYRHAVIYLFDSHWYIRPSSMNSDVLLNGFIIKEPIPLENQDEITLGDRKFVFVNVFNPHFIWIILICFSICYFHFFLNFRYDFLIFCKNFFEFHYDFS